jgi:hypothetical protein
MHFGKTSHIFWTICKKRAKFEYFYITAIFKAQTINLKMYKGGK